VRLLHCTAFRGFTPLPFIFPGQQTRQFLANRCPPDVVDVQALDFREFAEQVGDLVVVVCFHGLRQVFKALDRFALYGQ